MLENFSHDKLEKINPLLTPEKLGEIFPSYQDFSIISGYQYLYGKAPLSPITGQVILTIDAPPTGGQSSVLRLLSESPNAVVAPTLAFRPPRPDEKIIMTDQESNVIRSFHYLHIPNDLKKHELLNEIMEENDLWTRYALSRLPIRQALDTGKRYVLMVLDQHGTGILKNQLPNYFPGVTVLSLEILPQLQYLDYLEQIKRLRNPKEIPERISHAICDLEAIPCCADIIGLNVSDPSLKPVPLVTELRKFLNL